MKTSDALTFLSEALLPQVFLISCLMMGNRQWVGSAWWAIGNGGQCMIDGQWATAWTVYDFFLEKMNFWRQPCLHICCSGHDNDEQVAITICSQFSFWILLMIKIVNISANDTILKILKFGVSSSLLHVTITALLQVQLLKVWVGAAWAEAGFGGESTDPSWWTANFP